MPERSGLITFDIGSLVGLGIVHLFTVAGLFINLLRDVKVLKVKDELRDKQIEEMRRDLFKGLKEITIKLEADRDKAAPIIHGFTPLMKEFQQTINEVSSKIDQMNREKK